MTTVTDSVDTDLISVPLSAFEVARGALVELSGGTERLAGHVLSHLAAQIGLPTTAVGVFFLACLAARDTGPATQQLLGRVVTAPPARRGVYLPRPTGFDARKPSSTKKS